MMKRYVLGAAASMCLGLAAPALAQAADPVVPDAATRQKTQDLIFAREQAIYEGRAKAGMGNYLSFVATDYAAWPPYHEKPIGAEALKKDSSDRFKNKPNQEKLTLKLIDFHMNGSTAEIYYRTHMTMTADGKPVDLQYDNIHVWVHENGEWKVFGGLSRPYVEKK